MDVAALRVQVESALEGRISSPFAYRKTSAPETVGIPALERLTGGLPRGGLTEICGPESSGRTALLLSVLRGMAKRGELCAIVDGSDALDPHSLVSAGADLRRLLWVRCRNIEQTLRSAGLLLQGGGFGAVAIDLAGIPAPLARRIPLSAWFRLRGAVRDTRTALIVLERESTASTCASLVVRLEPEAAIWSTHGAVKDPALSPGPRPSHAHLLCGFRSKAEACRSRGSTQAAPRAGHMVIAQTHQTHAMSRLYC